MDEIEQGDPVEVATENARRKRDAIGGERTLGVDTLVALDGRIYGKPADEHEARATLATLSGRTHQVVSGLAFAQDLVHATTDVTFRTLTDDDLEWYVATGEWRGRAGGYAIQGRGAALVTRIEGDYLNVVGLPVAALLDAAPWLLAPSPPA